MSNTTLTTAQVRQMVHQFATNDEFRSLFEESPAKALVQLGISDEIIANLHSKCLKPCQLGSKATFQAASEKLDDESAQVFASFMVPMARLDFPR